MTEDRRKELAKEAKGLGEEGKVRGNQSCNRTFVLIKGFVSGDMPHGMSLQDETKTVFCALFARTNSFICSRETVAQVRATTCTSLLLTRLA